MNLLEKALIGGGIVLSSLLPMKSLAQETYTNSKGNIHIGLCIAGFNNQAVTEEIGYFPGLKIDYSKEIRKELRGRITTGYSGTNQQGVPFSVFAVDIGPQIEWMPIIGESNPLYFGVGLKYRSISSKDKKTKEREELSGFGFGINFGWEIKIDKKGHYFYLETEYDKVNANEGDIGFTKLTAGFKL